MTIGYAKVGDVLKLERRVVAVDPDVVYEEIGIRSFGRGIFHKEPVSGLDLGNKRVFRIQPGDLVISNVFGWEGAVALASEAETGKIGSHRFMTFTAVDDRISTAWAAWFFRSDPGLELIRKASPGSAGRNRTLAIDRFESLEIPLPPPDEQRRVASELDRIAAATSDLRSRNEHASALSGALTVSICARPDLSDTDKKASGWRQEYLGSVMQAAGASLLTHRCHIRILVSIVSVVGSLRSQISRAAPHLRPHFIESALVSLSIAGCLPSRARTHTSLRSSTATTCLTSSPHSRPIRDNSMRAGSRPSSGRPSAGLILVDEARGLAFAGSVFRPMRCSTMRCGFPDGNAESDDDRYQRSRGSRDCQVGR